MNKTARIVEEVSLKRIGADHVETVKDKIRRQQGEIERVGAYGKVLPSQKQRLDHLHLKVCSKRAKFCLKV